MHIGGSLQVDKLDHASQSVIEKRYLTDLSPWSRFAPPDRTGSNPLEKRSLDHGEVLVQMTLPLVS